MKKFFAAVCCCCLLAANVVAQDDAQPSISDQPATEQVIEAPADGVESVVDHGEIHHHEAAVWGDCCCAPAVNPCCPAPAIQCCPAPAARCCPAPRCRRPLFRRAFRSGSRGCCC